MTCLVEPINAPNPVITKISCDKSIRTLMQRINHLFIDRPRPRKCASTCCILHHLIQCNPNSGVHKARERPNYSIVRENSANSASYHAHSMMMNIVQQVDIAFIELWCHAEMVANCTSGNIRSRSMSDHLFNPVCTDHGKGADETGADTDRDSRAKANFWESRESRLGINIRCEELVLSMSNRIRRITRGLTKGAGGSVVLRHHDRLYLGKFLVEI